jgi:battenin
LVGAFLWWEVRKFGVRIGVGLSSVELFCYCAGYVFDPRYQQVMPLIIPLTYLFFLPHNTAFLTFYSPDVYGDRIRPSRVASSLSYTPLATNEEETEEEGSMLEVEPKRKVALTIDDKMRLVKPLLLKYMLPLCESAVARASFQPR